MRLSIAKAIVFQSHEVLNQDSSKEAFISPAKSSDQWGNYKYRKFGTSQVGFEPGTRILVAVGSLGVSGGTNIIFEYAYALKLAGANVAIGYIRGKSTDSQWHHLSKEFEIQHLSSYRRGSFDLGIMTWWKTVEPLLEIDCKKFLYFVQSLESRFAINSHDSEEELAAASTYLLGIPMITVAIWLQNVLVSISKTPTWRVKNGIDKDLFPLITPTELGQRKDLSEIRYLVEGTFGIPMKAVVETLQVCSELNLKSVTYVNPGLANPEYPNVKVLNQIPISNMHNIYREHDVLIKMSRVEALALPPIEAFHAGCTTIISKVTGSEEYIRNGINAITVEVDDFHALKQTILHLQANPNVVTKLKAGAISTASEWPDIKSTAQEFAAICYTTLVSDSLGNRPIGEPAVLLKNAMSAIQESDYLSSLLLNLTSQ
jgi:hypothetical protein